MQQTRRDGNRPVSKRGACHEQASLRMLLPRWFEATRIQRLLPARQMGTLHICWKIFLRVPRGSSLASFLSRTWRQSPPSPGFPRLQPTTHRPVTTPPELTSACAKMVGVKHTEERWRMATGTSQYLIRLALVQSYCRTVLPSTLELRTAIDRLYLAILLPLSPINVKILPSSLLISYKRKSL